MNTKRVVTSTTEIRGSELLKLMGWSGKLVRIEHWDITRFDKSGEGIPDTMIRVVTEEELSDE